jgi:endonuclease/exonuclease/phosphatase family metal-dependent hydrolase
MRGVRLKGIVMLLTLPVALMGCSRQGQPPAQHGDGVGRPITIMAFNVENLFDARDDPGKNDRTYLPLSAKQTASHRAACARIERRSWRKQCFDWDWSEAVVDHKLTVVANAILQVGNGRGPDIVALQEVENLAILERLRTDYLAAADYLQGILIEGDDNRGIDVAFLSRLPVVDRPRLHPIPLRGFGQRRLTDTRGILAATFQLPDGGLLTGYSVHFPAPYMPREMREQAYDFLNVLLARLPPERPAFAAGDFNTTSAEDADHDMLTRFARPHWRIAHQEECQQCPRGSSYFPPDRSWSYLDMVLYSPGRDPDLVAGWDLSSDGTFVANATPEQVRPDGTPANYRLPQRRGVSDHWPVVMTIAPTEQRGAVQ